MPNKKFFHGAVALCGLMLALNISACNNDHPTSSSPAPTSESSVPVASSSSTKSEESSNSSSVVTKYAVTVQADLTKVSVTDPDGAALLEEYEEGATVSFKVQLLDESYGITKVEAGGVELTASEAGIYSFVVSKKTTIRVSVELMTATLTTSNTNISLRFYDDAGALLEDQTGIFSRGSKVHFGLSSAVGGYLTFHDFTVMQGETELTATDGIYTIDSLTEDTSLTITAADHIFGEDDKCTKCGQSTMAVLFANWVGCTATYDANHGWKILSSNGDGFNYVMNPTVVDYYYAQGKTKVKVTYGNGTSFGTKDADGVVGNPVNVSSALTAYTSDLASSKVISNGFYPSASGALGTDDLCTFSFDLTESYNTLIFYANVTDSTSKATPAQYIYNVEFVDPKPVATDYFTMDAGGTCTYDASHGWKIDGGTGNHWKLSGSVPIYYQGLGKKKMRMTFGPAWDDAVADAQTSRLIINVSKNGATNGLFNSWISTSMTSAGDNKYYYDFDLTDSTIDWSWGVEFYDYGVNGKYIIYVYSIEFLD